MSSALFETIKMLEAGRWDYFIRRTRPDALTIFATLVGERLEICVFEDDHLEVSRFRGDESVEGGIDLLERILAAARSTKARPT